MTPEPVLRANGGTAWVAEKDLLIDLSQIPRGDRDTWLVVRVGGTESNLFPVMPTGGGTLDTSAETPETFFTDRHGIHAYVLTNPIYIDVDGDGLWVGSVD